MFRSSFHPHAMFAGPGMIGCNFEAYEFEDRLFYNDKDNTEQWIVDTGHKDNTFNQRLYYRFLHWS